MDCSLLGSSNHGIFLARILEWGAIAFSVSPTRHPILVLSQVCSASLPQYVNREPPDVQAGFRKDRNQRSNCQHLLDHQKSKRVPEKHLLQFYWLCQSLWLCGSQQTGKFWKRWKYQITWPASSEICMWVRKQQLELDMEQQTNSK